ncbi:LCP family protein [Hutsoniella sourekii]|uniref:LCP family protein n=1 Tax=Hutsoniella sourekii TaxID=87650 RepID=UPI00047F1954|nr:LCP family protein [Hutsoniella sourekii]
MSRLNQSPIYNYETLNPRQARSKRGKGWVFVFVLMIIFVIMSWLCIYHYQEARWSYQENINQSSQESSLLAPLTQFDTMNLLVLGLDYPHSGRMGNEELEIVDWLSLKRSNKEGQLEDLSGQVELSQFDLSMMRDQQGLDQLKKKIQAQVGRPIDRVIIVRFWQLRSLIDFIDGITIQVDQPVALGDSRVPANQDFYLTGRQFEQFSRKLEGESIINYQDRKRRLLLAIFDQLLSKEHWLHLTQAFQLLEDGVYSDMPFEWFFHLGIGPYQEALQSIDK